MNDQWTLESSEPVAATPIFSLHRQRHRHPLTGRAITFFRLAVPDWVNVIARRADGRIALIRQWRAGTGVQTLEIPGGMLEPGETPEAAARRELTEETGCVARHWQCLGTVHPNPAFQTNRCTTFLATEVDQVGPTAFDEGELITLQWAEPAEIAQFIADGDITHALVIAAWYWYERVQRSS